MPASVLTLYFDNPEQSGASAGRITPTAPAASTSTTGWTQGTTAAGNYSRLSFRQEKASSTFGATAEPSGAPTGLAQDCFRISAATTGDFSAGTWYSAVSVIGVTSGGVQDGRARVRFWRSANADGTSATEITAGAMVGTTITNLSTLVAQSSSASTSVGAFSVAGEYLFAQIAWETT